jgi:spore maturation protein CgeB
VSPRDNALTARANVVTSWLAENLAALARRHPALAEAIAGHDRGGVEMRAAADGSANLIVKGVPLHNVHAPLDEARRWAAGRLAELDGDRGGALLVPGFGCGHHVAALADATARRIVVVEPNLDVLRAALDAVDRRGLLGRIDVLAAEPSSAELDAMGDVTLVAFAPALASDRARLGCVRAAVQARMGSRDLRLRILVVSPVAGGSLPPSLYAARALEELGHAVSLLDLGPFEPGFRHLGAFAARGAGRRALEGRFVDLLAAGIVERAERERVDLVLALAQAPLTAEALERLSRAGVRTAFWFVEDFRRFAYWREVAPRYHHVFCIQREECLDAFAAAGVRAAYLPCAADPSVHRPVVVSPQERARFGSPVSFVGAGYRNRRVAFRRLIDLDFKVWGSEWEGADGLWGAVVQEGGRRVTPEESVRIFNASAVNLNLHSSTYVDGVDPNGDFVNPRAFELAGCAAFQLVDERRLLPGLFEPGVEIATFSSTAELRDRVAHYLARPDERAAIAEAGRRRVLAEHTYKARMAEMLAVVFAADYGHFRASRRGKCGRAAMVEAAGADTGLGRYLRQVCGDRPEASLADLARHIGAGRGALSEEEEILLFLKQFDEMFLTEHRV